MSSRDTILFVPPIHIYQEMSSQTIRLEYSTDDISFNVYLMMAQDFPPDTAKLLSGFSLALLEKNKKKSETPPQHKNR